MPADPIVARRGRDRGDYLIDLIIAARVVEAKLDLEMPPQARRAEPLTEGEMAVLRLVAQGVENQEIAEDLNYSVHPSRPAAHDLREADVTNRTQARVDALRQGWATLDVPRG